MINSTDQLHTCNKPAIEMIDKALHLLTTEAFQDPMRMLLASYAALPEGSTMNHLINEMKAMREVFVKMEQQHAHYIGHQDSDEQ